MLKTNRKFKVIFIITLSLLALPGAYFLGAKSRLKVYISDSSTIAKVPFSELVQNKGVYHNTLVMVSGYLSIGFEACEIYEEKGIKSDTVPDAICLNFNDLVQLNGDTTSYMELYGIYNKRVLIIGLYDSLRAGHFGICKGSISEISSITFF